MLADASAGGEAAFATIYRELAPAVLGFARGRGAPDPEDVVAETMTSVAKNLHKFRGDEPAFRSWVFTIAYRRLVDHRRRASRRVPIRPLADGEEWASGVATEDAVLGRYASESVLGALRRLGPEQRDVILLRVVGELSVREVATAMGKREGAIKMIQARALEQLRRALLDSSPSRRQVVVGDRDV